MQNKLPALPQVFEHPSKSSIVQNLLKPLLPFSLPVLRRIQHRVHNASTHLVATFSPEQAEEFKDLPQLFAIGFLDRSASPGVATWIFWSGELSQEVFTEKCAAHMEARDDAGHDAHLAALVAFMHGIDRPTAPDSQPTQDKDPLLFGVLHERTYETLDKLGLKADSLPKTPAKTYLLQMNSRPVQFAAKELPDGLVWDVIRESDFEAIINSNPYVRSSVTLRALQPGACVRCVDGGRPVAWALHGMDGSVRSLHVEEDFRRMGLGRALVVKLTEAGLKLFGDDGLASSHIFPGNTASQNLFEGLGFAPHWECYWVMIDLAAALKFVQSPDSRYNDSV